MDKITLRKVQLVQLEIAKEVKRICDKYDISYWLDSGTLLGAVRHKGFIPWDDDLDIGMLRKDYEKFMKIAPSEISPKYLVQNWDSDKYFGLPFGKIRKIGTRFIETKGENSKAENGIFVDIFPYDCYGNKAIGQGLLLKCLKLLMINKSNIQVWRNNEGIDYIKLLEHIPFIILSKICSRNWIINKYNHIAQKYNAASNKYYYPQGVINYGKLVIPKEVLDETIDALFEDSVFKIPKRYDVYLTRSYGNYMKLPPEDQRENRHQIIEVKF